jgi:hypothetical protein
MESSFWELLGIAGAPLAIFLFSWILVRLSGIDRSWIGKYISGGTQVQRRDCVPGPATGAPVGSGIAAGGASASRY